MGGSWVEYNGGTFAPTISPAPTHSGGCDDPHNRHLDICFRKRNKPKAAVAVWNSLGAVGQFSLFLVSFMAVTLSASIFLSRAKRRRKKKIRPLEEKMLDNDATSSSKKSRSRSRPISGKSKEKSKAPSRTRFKSRDTTKQKEVDRSRDKSRSTLSKKKSDSGRSTTSRSKSRGRGKSKSRKERDRSSSRSRRSKTIDKDERRQLV